MIKLIVLDVDGTLTDGKIYLSNVEEEIKAFNVKDGLGITQAISQKKEIVIITGRTSKIVSKRASELGITRVYQGVKDKVKVLDSLVEELNLDYENVAYMGDDINDRLVMAKCSYRGAPKDAVEEITSIANFISTKNGGDGAVREFIETILKKENLWKNVLKNFENINQ